MAIKRILKIVLIVVPFAVLYVWQNTQVFKTAYEVKNKACLYKHLLEKNNLLLYNVYTKRSSQEMGQIFLSEDKDLKIADSIFIVKAKTDKKESPVIYSKTNRENSIFRFFSPPAKAEPKP